MSNCLCFCAMCGSRKYTGTYMHFLHGRSLEIPWRGGGILKAKLLEESMKLNWNSLAGVTGCKTKTCGGGWQGYLPTLHNGKIWQELVEEKSFNLLTAILQCSSSLSGCKWYKLPSVTYSFPYIFL